MQNMPATINVYFIISLNEYRLNSHNIKIIIGKVAIVGLYKVAIPRAIPPRT